MFEQQLLAVLRTGRPATPADPDFDTHTIQSLQQPPGSTLGMKEIEVIAAAFLVAGTLAQQGPDNDQDAVRHGLAALFQRLAPKLGPKKAAVAVALKQGGQETVL